MSQSSRTNEVTSSYTVQPQDDGKLIVCNSSSALTVTLPQPGNPDWMGATFIVEIANIGTGTVTVSPTSSTIDGESSVSLSQYQGIEVRNDSSNFFTKR